MKKKSTQNIGKAVGLAGLAVAGIAGAYFLYGKNGKNNRKKVHAWALRAKADVMDKLEGAKEVSQETFQDVVDEVTAKYQKAAKNVSVGEVALFAKDLKKHWKDIKSELTPKAKKKTGSKTAPKKSKKKTSRR